MELLTLAVVVKKCLDFVRGLRAGNLNSVVTQLLAAAAAVGLVILVAHSELASLQTIFGIDLAHVNTATQVLVGLIVGIGGSGFVSDAIKAVDQHQSAAQPPLLPPKPNRATRRAGAKK